MLGDIDSRDSRVSVGLMTSALHMTTVRHSPTTLCGDGSRSRSPTVWLARLAPDHKRPGGHNHISALVITLLLLRCPPFSGSS